MSGGVDKGGSVAAGESASGATGLQAGAGEGWRVAE